MLQLPPEIYTWLINSCSNVRNYQRNIQDAFTWSILFSLLLFLHPKYEWFATYRILAEYSLKISYGNTTFAEAW